MTIKIVSPPRSIAQLLSEGHRILAEKQQQQEEEFRQRVAENRACWLKLCEQVREDLGEVARDLPADPPHDFDDNEGDYRFEFRPFGASSIFVRYVLYQDDWYHGGYSETNYKKPGIRVQTDFSPYWDVDKDNPSWHVGGDDYCDVDSLAEALALCEQATEAYRSCEEECKRKEMPHFGDPVWEGNSHKESDLKLTDAERRLVLLVRGLVRDNLPCE